MNQEDSIPPFPSPNGRQSIPPSGCKRNGTGFTQVSTHPSKGKGVAEEVRERKRSSSQYKGVVPQRNGRWGAQIYEKHGRIWLGTFDTAKDAAQSYDTAAIKIRGREAVTNFVLIDDTHPEAIFLRRHSTAEIVDMLRTHTYHEELHHSYNMYATESNGSSRNDALKVPGSIPVEGESAVYPREHLFDKSMTPSDVGRTSRMVIPKHQAQRCFLLDAAYVEKGVMLKFEDATGKTWRFKYTYWKSGQTYVLTKGWSRYAKDKHLHTGDIVTFERSTGACRQLYVTFRHRRPCDLLPYKSVAVGGFPLPTQAGNLSPIYSQWDTLFLSPSSVEQRSIIFKGFIPFIGQSACDFSPWSSIKLESDKNSKQPVHSNLPVKIPTSPISRYPSRVTVFGVNLSPSVSSAHDEERE